MSKNDAVVFELVKKLQESEPSTPEQVAEFVVGHNQMMRAKNEKICILSNMLIEMERKYSRWKFIGTLETCVFIGAGIGILECILKNENKEEK